MRIQLPLILALIVIGIFVASVIVTMALLPGSPSPDVQPPSTH